MRLHNVAEGAGEAPDVALLVDIPHHHLQRQTLSAQACCSPALIPASVLHDLRLAPEHTILPHRQCVMSALPEKEASQRSMRTISEPGAHLQVLRQAHHAPVQRHVMLVKLFVRADMAVEQHHRAPPAHQRRCPHLCAARASSGTSYGARACSQVLQCVSSTTAPHPAQGCPRTCVERSLVTQDRVSAASAIR